MLLNTTKGIPYLSSRVCTVRNDFILTSAKVLFIICSVLHQISTSATYPTIFNYFINNLFMFEDGFKTANYTDDNTICASAVHPVKMC